MGEAKARAGLKLSATQKLIAQFPTCCFCGGDRPSATREHMPPTSLFDAAHRPDGFVMPACKECNSGTSTADLAVALIARWGDAGTPQEQLDHARFARRVLVQAPTLRDEWMSIADDPVASLRARAHLIAQGVRVPPGVSLATIGPETVGQLNLFAHKAVLAIYFHHFKRGLAPEGRVFASWRTKEDFARDGVPQIFFDMFSGHGAIAQGKWDEQKTFEYRFPTRMDDGLFGCLARFRQGFFVYGFTADNPGVLPQAELVEWVAPSEVLSISNNRRRKI
jgi:hypothetical protein